MSDRISYLDGLRGVAISSVVLFHAFYHFAKLEPFEQNAALSAVSSFGWLGVQLFFAISGYVIYMSLLKSQNILMFGIARYLRLAPVMLMASVLIFVTAWFIPDRPLGAPSLVDFIPSLTFIDPGILSKLTGVEIRSLEGAFWSLYIEVKFYAVAAILFFGFKDRGLIGLQALYGLWLAVFVCIEFQLYDGPAARTLMSALNYVGVKHYGWFLLGVLAYKYHSAPTLGRLISVLAIAAVAIWVLAGQNVAVLVGATATAAIFVVPMMSEPLRRLLSAPVLLFVGYISYPLYLTHENAVTGLAIQLHSLLPGLPGPIYPLPFIALVIALSYVLARIEPRVKTWMAGWVPATAFGHKLRRGVD